MSSRSVWAVFVVSTSTAALAFASAMAACSGDEPAAAGDAATDGAAREENRPAPPEPDARTKSCREQCDEAHPSGVPKDQAVNACWETYCRKPCIEDAPGDGGIDADGAAPDGGSCISPVVTISVACDECTNTFCCTSWDECFQEPECAALNACYQQCSE